MKNLDILFIGSIVPDVERFHTNALNRSGNLAQMGLVRGLTAQGFSVDIFSLQPQQVYPRLKKIYFCAEEVSESSFTIKLLPFINLPIFKNMSFSLAVFIMACRRALTKRGCIRHIIVYNPFIPPLFVLYILGLVTQSKITVILYDVGVSSSTSRFKGLKRLLDKIHDRFIRYFCRSVAGRIAITQDVVDDYGANKPSLLLDGGIGEDIKSRLFPLVEKAPNVCIRLLLSGTLNSVNGVDLALQAMTRVKSERIQLVFAGKGPMVDSILQASKLDRRIEYLGSLTLDQLFDEYEQSDYLLNLRILNESKVYVFPSKFFEYLAVGKPTITTNTSHLKDAYGKYAILLSEPYLEGLVEILNRIVKYGVQSDSEVGMAARAYMLKSKTWLTQSTRVADYLKSL